MPSILLLNGPNLNLLGTREPEIYGSDTLDDITKRLDQVCKDNKVEFQAFQSNAESELVEKVQQAKNQGVDFIIINPAAFTHTSLAIADAFSATGIPFIEIHISNIFSREDFRKTSYFSALAEGVICGLGTLGYDVALQAAMTKLKKNS